MFGSAVIVFRETLEAALFVGIVAAATRGLAGRANWLAGGVFAGVIGALALAAGADKVSALADGIVQFEKSGKRISVVAPPAKTTAPV